MSLPPPDVACARPMRQRCKVVSGVPDNGRAMGSSLSLPNMVVERRAGQSVTGKVSGRSAPRILAGRPHTTCLKNVGSKANTGGPEPPLSPGWIANERYIVPQLCRTGAFGPLPKGHGSATQRALCCRMVLPYPTISDAPGYGWMACVLSQCLRPASRIPCHPAVFAPGRRCRRSGNVSSPPARFRATPRMHGWRRSR